MRPDVLKSGGVSITQDFSGAGEKAAFEAGATATIGIVRDGYNKLQNAKGLIDSIDYAQDILKKDVIVGPGADYFLTVKRFLKAIRVDVNDDEIAQSETLKSVLMNRVAESLKMTFGAQLSDPERAYLETAMGKLSTDPTALRDILDFYRNKAISMVETHNKLATGVQKYTMGIPLTIDLGNAVKTIPEDLPDPSSVDAVWWQSTDQRLFQKVDGEWKER
jgi:hypothetical protein